MDDVRAMLSFDASCVQRKAVNKLLQQVVHQLKPDDLPLSANAAKRIPELELLVEQCGGQPECCEALVSLVVGGQLEWRFGLGQLLGACTAQAADRQPSGAVAAMGRLLTLHMRGVLQADAYRCPFALRSHPLVLVLRERPDCWDAVQQTVQEALDECRIGQEEALLEMLRPLLLHCLVGPIQPTEHQPLRLWLWLALAQHWPRYLGALLPWMPLCVVGVRWQLQVFEQLLGRVAPPSDGYCALQSLAACLLALDINLNCRVVLQALLKCLHSQTRKDVDAPLVWDACLVLVAMLLTRAPTSCLAVLLDVCDALLGACSQGMVRCLVLPLCQLPQGLQGRAAALLARLTTPLSEEGSPCTAPCALPSSHPLVAGALFSAQCLRVSPAACLERWRCLRCVLPGRDGALFSLLVASSTLVSSRTPSEAQLSLELLRQEVDACAELSPSVLPLLLYVVGRSHCPATLTLLLHSLAVTACHKYALGPLWSSIRALSAHHPVMASMLLPSLATLCVRQPQALPLLLQMLEDSPADTADYSLALAKAQAIDVLLQHSASQHGANLLNPLVSLVATCRTERQGAAVVLALRCLQQLCTAEVVNVRTTLSSVVPKLWKDDRPLVVQAVCELMSVVPMVSVPTVEYERYEQDTAGRLWRLAMTPEAAAVVRGGAFRALAAFPANCHSLKHMPAEAKVNLKVPASKTPMDLGRSPEELLTYTPGHCFLDLLVAIEDDQVLHDYGQLLSSLVKHEVSQLPRSVYTTSRVALSSSSSDASAHANIGVQLCTLYEANRFPAIQGSLAVGTLLTYEPPATSRGKPGCALHEGYMRLLPSLLQDIPLDGADWARCLVVTPAWGAWVRRAFRAAEETRRRELKDEAEAEATSWLWARDTLTDAIKANCTGRASQQGNALLALCALLEATTEHLQCLDMGARRQAARNHTAWAHALLNLVLQCCGLSREEPPDQMHYFQWLLKASSGMLIRGCASMAVGGLLGLLHRRDPHCVVPLLEALTERLLAAEGGPTGQLLTGAGLAASVSAAVRLGLVDAASDSGVRAVVLRLVKQLLYFCLGNTVSEPKPGQLLCLALCLGSLVPIARGDQELWQMVIDSCTRFCQDLRAADPDTCSFEVRCVSTTLVVCSAAQELLSLSSVEELLLWFEKRRQEDPQCQGTALSVGLLVRTLVEKKHPKGPLLWSSLLPHWVETMLAQNQPTLGRLAALRGLSMALGGANNMLMVGIEEADEHQSERRQVQEQLVRLLSRSSARDVALAGCAAWTVGQLSAGSHARSASSVPLNYSYLGEASVLRPLVDFLSASVKAGSWNCHTKACLEALNRDFGRALPPLNWTALLVPILRDCPSETGLPDLVLGVALRSASSSPAMATFLATCAAPPLLYSLPSPSLERLLCGLPTVVKSAPSSKLVPFLELAADRAFKPGGLTILQGVETVLGDHGSELPPGARGALCELLTAVARRCQDDVWDAQERALLPALGRCAVRLTPDSRVALLDALTNLPLLLALQCHLAAAGKAPSGCNIFSMATSLSGESDRQVLWLLSQCLCFPEPVAEEVGRQMSWFADCLVAIKAGAMQQEPKLLRFQLRVLSLITLVLSKVQLPVSSQLAACSHLEPDLWSLLPEALAALLLGSQSCWRDVINMVLEWLSEMLALEVPTDVHQLLLSCACRLRFTPEYGSIWTQLLPGPLA